VIDIAELVEEQEIHLHVLVCHQTQERKKPSFQNTLEAVKETDSDTRW